MSDEKVYTICDNDPVPCRCVELAEELRQAQLENERLQAEVEETHDRSLRSQQRAIQMRATLIHYEGMLRAAREFVESSNRHAARALARQIKDVLHKLGG